MRRVNVIGSSCVEKSTPAVKPAMAIGPGGSSPRPYRELIAFFALAFGVTWTCSLSTMLIRHAHLHDLVLSAGQCGPLVAALALTFRSSGRRGLERFCASLFRRRFHVGVALVALALPPATFYAAIALKSYRSGEPADIGPYRLVYDVLINFFLIALWGGPLG